MATIEKYKTCIQRNKELGRKMSFRGGHKPPLKLIFGKKLLVNEFDLMHCTKSEQRRHLREDAILTFLYIEN